MFRNHITVALRNAQRQPGYAAINVLGLALGLGCCLLIALFVLDELAHDRQHPEADRLYRLTNHVTASDDVMHIAVTPAVYAPTAAASIPEIEAFARLHPAMGEVLIRRGETRAFEEDVLYADASFLEIFGFPLRSGDPVGALSEPFSAVISPALATKYFGDEDPIGQTIRIDEAYDYTVTGLLADEVRRTHLRFDALFSMRTLESLSGVWVYGSGGLFFSSYHLAAGYSYIRLLEGADPAVTAQRITELVEANVGQGGPEYRLELQPVTDIYLRSDIVYELRSMGSIVYVWVFIAVALFMLAIAAINYMNLATARSLRRALEVGVRKVLGAERGQLGRQFLAESMLTAMAALAVALALAAVAMPLFNTLTGKELTVAALFDAPLLAGAAFAALVVGLLAGSYPALVLSSLPPLSMLGRSVGSGAGGAGLRRVLVVTQFTATVVLLVGTATVYQQLTFFEKKDIGFDREELVHFRIPDVGLLHRMETIKARMADHPGVVRVGASSSIPGVPTWRHDTRPGGRPADERWLMAFYAVDHDFVETLDLEVLAGRSFSRAFPSDTTEAYLLNETAVARLGWQDDPVGRDFAWVTATGPRRGRVVGVVRDFHFESLRNAIEPTFFAIEPEAADRVAVRLRPGQRAGVLAHLGSVWQELLPNHPFEYAFLDETLGETYSDERRFGNVFGLFTLLTMLVACMGLFGLAAFTAQQRTREVGVRKVLGASILSLVTLLSMDFLKLVAIAFLIAAPLAYYAMNRWLEGFAYRIELGPALFVVAGLTALAVALLTVTGQALRAATADPVEAIRSE